ncbi:MAG: asparagine synthetase B [Candidatus Parcubacteria bacterium]|nr:MAG: asparagine synthetase B [Candidatus Parcubacteria bacterium]
MCRITGFWDFNYKGEYDLDNVLTQMRDVLKHGGPDDAGNYLEKDLGLGLANRRLSILDLSPLGHQPMIDDKNEIVVVFNGEIYNFQEIKKELEGFGYKFKSNSDTEVIIYAYKHWRLDCLSKFRGMFAIAIWDKRREELILIRDRIGVKPLYYYFSNGLFMFASETKAFLKHPKFKKEISKEGLFLFFRYGYIFYPYSIWQNVYKLETGSYLIIDKNKNLKKEKYWDLGKVYEKYFEIKDKNFDENELIENLEQILIESFKLRLVSDVPVGVFLSGGIDSSTVTALLQRNISQKLKTFTIGFYETKYDESKWAKKIAEYLGTDHTEMFCSINEALEIIPKLPEIYDEPFGDSSAIPTHLVSKIAREKVKVILSGDGGDEFFGGYDRYWIFRIVFENRLVFNKFLEPFWRLILKVKGENQHRIEKSSKLLRYKNINEGFSYISSYFLDDYNQLVNPDFRISSEINFSIENNKLTKLPKLMQWMLIDAKYYLSEDILVKVDRASMAVALETREPLLDHKILEFVAPLPLKYKFTKNSGKYILKKLLAKYLPRELFERPKHGFGIPQDEWLKIELKKLLDELTTRDIIKQNNVLNYDFIDKLKTNFYLGKENSNKIWFLLMFQLWANRYL